MKRGVALLALALAFTARGAAQQLTRADQAWRTVETTHFVIHYPESMSEWALEVAHRIEAVHRAVTDLVGSATPHRTTVVVDDPYNLANGLTFPFLDHPTVLLWPTPPEPRMEIGHIRSWPEILSVHEYAHVVHLTRPSRNSLRHFLASLLPGSLGPLALRSPRWVIEGYATYVEGRITGSGRPFGVYRPAILRQWALEGKLPTYAQLNGSAEFEGGAMAYLAGSAYLEWLAARSGDSSLVHLWRRLSARRNRSFGEAFTGVFGGSPEDLYGRFTAELTGKAIDVRRDLVARRLVEGDTVQSLSWLTGEPALSPDGSLIALVLSARNLPPRIVIWKAADEGSDTAVARARERLLKHDPEDVADIRWRPAPKRPIATLWPFAGMPHENPRWMPDGVTLLVTRYQAVGDGSQRADLFAWNHRTGELRRITRGAGIRHADPSPDGKSAVADRCLGGRCDIVRVNLQSGVVQLLAPGSPTLSYYRPRYSADGQTIAAAVQRLGRWRIVTLDTAGGAPHIADPEDFADRYDVAWMRDGRSLIVTSELGGVANLEQIEIGRAVARPLTRVTGAAYAPEPGPGGSILFLRLHARGLDLARIRPGSAPALDRVAFLRPALAPASPAATLAHADSFAVNAVSPVQSYGIGPSRLLFTPVHFRSVEGSATGLTLIRTDPVGRLTVVAQGMLDGGVPSVWKGYSLSAAWRGFRPALTGELFTTRHHPSLQRAGTLASPAFDVNYAGGALYLALDRNVRSSRAAGRLGASIGSLDGAVVGERSRRLALLELATGVARTRGAAYVSASLGGRGYAGTTGGDSWTREIVTAGLRVGARHLGLVADALAGQADAGTSGYERFVIGGSAPPLFDPSLLSQRLAMPALPFATAEGRRAAQWRVALAGDGFQPYLWAASAGERIGRWHRVVGAESTLLLPPLPIVRLPATRTTLGAGYSLDEPFKYNLRAYFGASFRP
ncbi:MAG: hypothetical protein M3068_05170 [Gemmatimonadota bacterium]|nr:hypothetical protein [Gemmatimonadota bacterium]